MTIFLGIVLAVVVIAIVMWMLLTRRLREKYAVMWLVIGVVVLVLGLFPEVLTWLSGLAGVAVPSNMVFALAIVLLLGVSLHLSWELSQAEDEIRRVAEDVAILRADLDDLQRRASEDAWDGPEPS